MTQELATAILNKGFSVFLTGPAGSGKTHVLNQFIQSIETKKKVAITASTGIAATHLAGSTIHSWSGIGIRDSLPDNFLSSYSPVLKRNIEETDVLVVDEVSMLSDYHLDMVDQVCRSVRKISEPFGGLQVIFCGDFYQLPPVDKESRLSLAANSQAWQRLNPVICYLVEQYRQTDDGLLDILTALRHGQLEPNHLDQLKERVVEPLPNSTELYCHNRSVDAVNEEHLEAIKARPYNFFGEGQGSPQHLANLKKRCLAPENLVLKKGALVMFVKNDTRRQYVNGTLGEVIGFTTRTGGPVVETLAGRKVNVEPASWHLYGPDGTSILASWRQIPLRLAWAITVHKSQGMTLDRAHVDLSEAFTPNMGYVALSRVRSLDNLTLAGFNQTALSMDQRVVVLDDKLRQASALAAQDYSYLTQG